VVSDWTGFYIGVHGGYGWARPGVSDFDLNRSNVNRTQLQGDLSADPNFALHAPRLKGALFGGHAGYNWQWGQRSIVGLEIDYSAANIKSTQGAIIDRTADAAVNTIDTRSLTSKLDSLASARARAGFLIGPDFLLYGTGGAAWGRTKFTDTFDSQSLAPTSPSGLVESVSVSRASTNHFGWVAGAGAEWKLWNSGLMLRVEYLHYGFGGASVAFGQTTTRINRDGHTNVIPTFDGFNLPIEKLTTDVVRGGLSYKF